MTYAEAVQKVFDWQYRNTGSYFNLIVLALRKAGSRKPREACEYLPGGRRRTPRLGRGRRLWQ